MYNLSTIGEAGVQRQSENFPNYRSIWKMI